MRYYREHRKRWLMRNWWWLASGYGTVIVLGMWFLIAESTLPDKTAMLFAASLSAAALTGVLIKAKPTHTKRMTWRQARFNPGRD